MARRTWHCVASGWVDLLESQTLFMMGGIVVFLASLIGIIPVHMPTEPAIAGEPGAAAIDRNASSPSKIALSPQEPGATTESITIAAVAGTLTASPSAPSATIPLPTNPPGLETPLLSGSAAASQTADIVPARSDVIRYTVLPGDTVFSIAMKFGLNPHTIYWANLESLKDKPDRLRIGAVLNVLPVDGIYHLVSDGETAAGLAGRYGVEPAALYNEWNDLEQGQALTPGLALVIPGGQGAFAPWRVPERSQGAAGSADSSTGQWVCGREIRGAPGRGRFDWPTPKQLISGWYFHDKRKPSHVGLDIGLMTGDPVYAADGGIIAFAGWSKGGGYGNLVVVDHLNGWTTRYAHLSKVKVNCSQQVGAGDLIGLGGSTGWSTGPHLHFEIRLKGVPKNPLKYLP
jgi:murein DD-endopeptidase MepM/ murein hydrolase activator NlpD